MNQQEALKSDRQHNILPGGQGEHDFNLTWQRSQIEEVLVNYAEHCGGLYRDGNPAALHTSGDGSFYLHFNNEGMVTRIDTAVGEYGVVLYWDSRRCRTSSHYQYGNASQPFLDDLVLTDEEVAEDNARAEADQVIFNMKRDAELAWKQKVKKAEDDYNNFLASHGFDRKTVRNPHLLFELRQRDSEPEQQKLLHSETTNLGRMLRTNQREYDYQGYIFLPSPTSEALRVGDVIIRVKNGNDQYMNGFRGVITKEHWGEELQVCYSASAHWNPVEAMHRHDKPSCSGGPWEGIDVSKCQLMGTVLQRFWYWQDGYSGGGLGADYLMSVNLWHYVD